MVEGNDKIITNKYNDPKEQVSFVRGNLQRNYNNTKYGLIKIVHMNILVQNCFKVSVILVTFI